MKKSQWKPLSTEQIVAEFRERAVRHGEFMREGLVRDANRQFDALVAMRRELQERGASAQRLLLRFLDDSEPAVRCWAAMSVLETAPAEAERVLAGLAETQKNSVGSEASGVLEQWKAGTLHMP